MLRFLKQLFGNKPAPAPALSRNVEDFMDTDVRAIVVTDLGNIRTNNEDAGRFIRMSEEKIRDEKGYLAIVADGMGGHAAGEIASQWAVEIIAQHYFKLTGDIETCLRKAIEEANRVIYAEAQRNTQRKGMGTTCTVAVVKGQKVYFAQVGDSRLYHLHDGQLYQLTQDQTVVQEMVRQGTLKPEEAERHPNRNVLSNALGTKPSLKVETGQATLPFDAEDRLLLCSDGLYDYFRHEEITNFLMIQPLKESAYSLVNTAKLRGGHDNITVVVVEWQTVLATTPERVTTDLDLPESPALRPTSDFETLQ
ncbi:MAG: Stp1/IreP family PP2C-type Ser/Thr phosphatase [Spirosomataceae bacterium]